MSHCCARATTEAPPTSGSPETSGVFGLLAPHPASATTTATAAAIEPLSLGARMSPVNVSIARYALGVPTLAAYDYGIRTFDSLWYHMPWAAAFAQTGHVTPLRFDLEFLLAFYPATAELFHGLGITLLARDTLSPAINLIWLGLALLAAWCIGRPRGRGGASVAGVAIVLAAPMMYFSQPGSADGDALGVFLLLAAVALLL